MLQAMKTGALLRFACEAGGILGGAGAAQRAALERYGAAVGQAFQIADDLLDLEGDPALVGKSTGKDAAAGKATMVSVLGVAGAKARLERTGGRGRGRRWRRSGGPPAILIEARPFRRRTPRLKQKILLYQNDRAESDACRHASGRAVRRRVIVL